MNPLTRNHSCSSHSRNAALPRPDVVVDQSGASASLKSFIERQDGLAIAQCSHRLEESSEVAVVAPAASSGVGEAVRFAANVTSGEPTRRLHARSRSFRRTSSTRQLLHSQSLHSALIPKSQPKEDKPIAVLNEPVRRERKRMSITAKDFADLIAPPKGDGTSQDEPIKLSYDLPRAVAEMSAMNVLPPSFSHKAEAQPLRPLHTGGVDVGDVTHQLTPTYPSTHESRTEALDRARRRSSARFHPKVSEGSVQFRRASSDVGTIDKEWEQPSMRRTVSLDDKNLEVMNVPILRRRSSINDGRKGRATDPVVSSGSDHTRPPRRASLTMQGGSDHQRPPRRASLTMQGARPSYRESPVAISAGSDRSSQRSESITSREDEAQTLEFLASFSEFSELTDEWEPKAFRRAKSLDDQKIEAATDHLYRSRALSEDLTSPTERSSGVYSDTSRTTHPPRPPRQHPGHHHRLYSPSTPSSSSGGSAGQSPSTALHVSVHQRGVPRRRSSLLLHREHPKSDS